MKQLETPKQNPDVIVERIVEDMVMFINKLKTTMDSRQWKGTIPLSFDLPDLLLGNDVAGRRFHITNDMFHTLFYRPHIAEQLGWDSPEKHLAPMYHNADFWIGGANPTVTIRLRGTYWASLSFQIMDGKLQTHVKDRPCGIDIEYDGATETNVMLMILANRDLILGKMQEYITAKELECKDRINKMKHADLANCISLANRYAIAQTQCALA